MNVLCSFFYDKLFNWTVHVIRLELILINDYQSGPIQCFVKTVQNYFKLIPINLDILWITSYGYVYIRRHQHISRFSNYMNPKLVLCDLGSWEYDSSTSNWILTWIRWESIYPSYWLNLRTRIIIIVNIINNFTFALGVFLEDKLSGWLNIFPYCNDRLYIWWLNRSSTSHLNCFTGCDRRTSFSFNCELSLKRRVI